jgi:hypothetical protein
MLKYVLLGSLLLWYLSCDAQEKYRLKDNLTAKGYLKYMQTNTFTNADTIITDNLLHNRVNTRWYLPKNFTLGAEFRNRVFYGDVVRLLPDYGTRITSYDGVLPLEILWVNTPSLVINTIIDRLWLDYSTEKVELRVGRQRINWGLNTVWNPNDLFNALDYLDFDYEERPGSDALRGQLFMGEMSVLDVAYKWAEDSENDVFAARYKFNTNTYDIQVLAGKYQQDFAAGLGWAGNIGQAGFKGEGTWFVPLSDSPDTIQVLSFSTTLEYGFKNGWSGMISYLLNTGGTNEGGNLLEFSQFTTTAKSLLPNKHTVFLNGMKQLSPVFAVNLGGFYSFGVNWLIFFPTVTYSIKENWDIDFVGQLFWGEDQNGAFSTQGNALFLRLKWSF